MYNADIAELDEFFAPYICHNFHKKNIILSPHVVPSGVSYIIDGIVRIYYINDQGKEITLQIIGKGDFYNFLVNQKFIINNYYYESLTDVVVKTAPEVDFKEFLFKNPYTQYEIMKRYAMLNFILKDSLSHTIDAADIRILHTLLRFIFLYKIDTNHEPLQIYFPFSQKIIASLSGLTKEHTCIQLKSLLKKKIISIENKTLYINNVSALLEKINFSNILYNEKEE